MDGNVYETLRSTGVVHSANCCVRPAGVDGAHGRWGEVWVVLNGHRLLHVVLADVLIHLLHRQRLAVLVGAAMESLEGSRNFILVLEANKGVYPIY